MQMAVSAISDMNKRVRSGAIKNKDEWLDTVSRNRASNECLRIFLYHGEGPSSYPPRDGWHKDTMLINLPVTYDFCVSVPISH